MDTAKKKAELEKRLQDVSGQLSGTKSKSKKNAGKCKSNSICNIYKPWLQGVFNKYMTRVQSQKKFISGKIPMTKDEGRIFVNTPSSHGSYDIYYDENINQQNHYRNKSPFHTKVMFAATKCSHELERQSWLTFKSNG